VRIALAVGSFVVGSDPWSDVSERWMLKDLGAESWVCSDRGELVRSEPSGLVED
jgi:hypothetical protein